MIMTGRIELENVTAGIDRCGMTKRIGIDN